MKKIFTAALILILTAFQMNARKVTGSVKCGETKLQGVIVTDGTNFTQTMRNGKFSMDIKDDAEFVYIVTPAGYVADWSSGVPAFYMKAPGCSRFDFQLQRTAGGEDYHIVAIADPQTYSDEHFATFSDKPMTDLISTTENLSGVAAGLSLGDISWDRIEILDMYKKEIVRTGIPFYPVVGNHDNEAYIQGDAEASATYRSKMGPENYAFCLGKDIVIVLDNIIYDTNFKMTAGYTDEIISWVRKLVRLIPSDATIYFAQHTPLGMGDRRIKNADSLLDIVRGREVIFLTGHSHENNIFDIEKNITEHNVAALCGAWWDTKHCIDGTPSGYKVFTKLGGNLSWYYKSIGEGKNYIAEAFGLGETERHPNAVVVKVWDWDPDWKVEWYEDGEPKGRMEQTYEISPIYKKEIETAYAEYGEEIPGWKRPGMSDKYFYAVPERYSKRVTISVQSPFGQKWVRNIDLTGSVEIQGICSDASVKEAKDLIAKGVNTISLDLYADMEGNVTIADGTSLDEFINTIEAYTKEQGFSPIRYSFKMKTVSGAEEGKTVPYYHDFIDACMKVIWPKYLDDRMIMRGNDHRTLNFLKNKYPEVYVAYELPEDAADLETAMKKISFTPKWINAASSSVNDTLIKTCKEKGYLLAVWGIPDEATEAELILRGINAVITEAESR